ncbi:MAG: sugar ABC transporter permease [Clostridia bacterium]|nr:sugar ABC transporter permease [Clostridia bacterium]
MTRNTPGIAYNRKLIPYLFILPNMVLFVAFMILPIFMTGYYSLTKWNGIGPKEFIGLANYFKIFSNSVFLTSLKNTFVFSLAVVPLEMALGLLTAMLLNQPFKLRGFVRASLYLPCMISSVITGLAFMWLFDTNLGLLNYLLSLVGVAKVPWAESRQYAMLMIIITYLWHYTGSKMVIYLAALQGIPSEYYEAATVDGANGFQRFIHITIPMLKGTNLFVMITSIIESFKAFDLIHTMTGGGPRNATSTLVMYIYNTAFVNNNFGRASAAGIILFVFLFIFTLLRFRAERSK